MERAKEEQERERDFLVSETARLLEFEKASRLTGRSDIDEGQLKRFLAERKARRIDRIIKAVEAAERAEVTKHNLKQLDEMFPGMSSPSNTPPSASKSPKGLSKKMKKGGSTIAPPLANKMRQRGGKDAPREKRRSQTIDVSKLQPRGVFNNNISIPMQPSREASELLMHDGLDHDRTDYTTFYLDDGEDDEEDDDVTKKQSEEGEGKLRLSKSLDDWNVPNSKKKKKNDRRKLLASSSPRPKTPPASSPHKGRQDLILPSSSSFSQLDTLSLDASTANTDSSSFDGVTDIPPSWHKDCTF